jgi:hypothetical protein
MSRRQLHLENQTVADAVLIEPLEMTFTLDEAAQAYLATRNNNTSKSKDSISKKARLGERDR